MEVHQQVLFVFVFVFVAGRPADSGNSLRVWVGAEGASPRVSGGKRGIQARPAARVGGFPQLEGASLPPCQWQRTAKEPRKVLNLKLET